MNRVVDGFQFTSDEDVKLAQEEIQRINYISDKLKEGDPASILVIYNKSVQTGVFTTPIGLDFLKRLQNYLYKNPDIKNEEVLDIPVKISYTDAMILRQNERYNSLNKKRDFKQPYRFSLLVNLILIIMVIAMFVIALKADNPNILNYKTAILNEYSEWEQELTEREQVIREKEKELDIEVVP